MRYLFLIFAITLKLSLFSQSEIKLMQYNLLYYDKDIYDCDASTNNTDTKNAALRTITEYVQPDILCVNEMNEGDYSYLKILDEVLNVNGVDYFKAKRGNGSFTINAVYYNSKKMSLANYQSFSFSLGNGYSRYMDCYKMTILTDPPTTVTFIVAHLKAGTGDEDTRANATSTLMYNIENNYLNIDDNYVFSGDFNFYNSDEEGYQNLINYSNADYKLYDPVNKAGNWNDNCYYADYHTQATHTSSNGCPVTGGLDDRFDFILVSPSIQNHTAGVSYVSSDYVTVGQDGEHCNSSINDGYNYAVPSDVADALYTMSDHLPVSLTLKLDNSIPVETLAENDFKYNNPVSSELRIETTNIRPENYIVKIYNLNGQLINTFVDFNQGEVLKIDFSSYQSGMYIVEVSAKESTKRFKIIKTL